MKTYLNLYILGLLVVLGTLSGCSARGGYAVSEGLREYSRQMQQYQPRNCVTNFVGNTAFTNCY